MISDNLAKPLTKVASKTFSKMYNPNKITIQKIFRNHLKQVSHDCYRTFLVNKKSHYFNVIS